MMSLGPEGVSTAPTLTPLCTVSAVEGFVASGMCHL